MIWKEAHEVVISRTLKPYALRVEVWPEDIEIGMHLDEFLSSCVNEVGNPTLVVTKDQLFRKLKAAAEVVCEKMKSDITQVVTGAKDNGRP